jgi:outer membrane protein OmpA-like peptidoglycan-associated protein
MSPPVRALAAAAAVLAGVAARADDPTARGFDADPVRWGLGLERAFAVESAGVAPAGTITAELLLDYAEGLLALGLGEERSDLLEHRLSAHLLAGWAVGRFELGAHLPVVLSQEADFSLLTSQGVTGPLVAPVASTTLGDLRLVAKTALFAPGRLPVDLAALLDLRLPTGDGDAFASDGLAVVPSAVASRTFGRLRLDGQLGYHFRGEGQYAQLVVHDGLAYGLAASLALPAFWRIERWRAIAEVTGEWPRGNGSDEDRYKAPLSARAGLRATILGDLALEAGAGTGLGEQGYGREAWRVFLGLRWERVQRDRDGDGVPDRTDACPDTPGPKENAGCPDPDLDRDGVLNRDDACPREPGRADLDGCPDRDEDTIPDREDRCPEQAGPAQADGCPVAEGEPVVEIETERLSLRDAINFDTGKDTIRRESFRILDEIAAIIQQHGEIERIRVEGHTDDVGAAGYNKDLSQRRASAVVEHLVSKGVSRDRLVPVGYGFERPVASNATALGRAKNRRVEFTILPPGASR